MLIELLTLSVPLLGGGPGETAVPLSHKRYRAWDIQLPAETFTPVGEGIALAGGRTFRAALEGTNLLLDVDGDGETDVRVEGDAGSVLLRTDDGFRYAVRLVRGANGWGYAASGAMTGTIDGTLVSIIDQDNDGRFGEVGEDAVIVGRGNIATWLGETLQVGGKLHAVSVPEDGSTLLLRDFEGPTGALAVTDGFHGGGKILSAVVRSTDGRHCFDLANADGAVNVPAGDYRIESGSVGMGTMLVTIGPGTSAPIAVAADGSTNFEWGGPVRAEFAMQRAGDQLGFSPDQVWYFGASGEEYEKWFPVGKSPVFVVLEADTGQEIARAMFPGSC